MKSAKITLSLLLLFLNSTFAQTQSQWQWAKQDGDALATPPSQNTAAGNGISYSRNDNTSVVVGTYTGDLTNAGSFGGATVGCWGASDIFIEKITSTGTNVWGKKAGSGKADKGNGIVCHSNGEFYITGQTYNGAVFSPLAALTLPPPTYFWYAARYDINGNCLSVKTRGYQSVQTKDDEGLSICVDAANDYVYVGGYENVRGLISKINTTSSTAGEWYAYLKPVTSGSEAICTGVTMDGDGNIVATGNFKGQIKLYNGSSTDLVLGTAATANTYDLMTAGDWDIFTIKLRTTGNVIWYTQCGGASDDFATGIASNNNTLLAGATYGTGYFHSSPIKFISSAIGTPNTITKFCAGQNDIYVCAFQNSDGTLLSANTYGDAGDERSNAVTYRNGANSSMSGPVITGNVQNSSIIYQPCLYGSFTGNYPFVLKTDDKCELIDSWWYNQVMNTTNTGISSNSICTDRRGYFFITGGFNQQLLFNSNANGQLTCSTNTNVFTACIQNFAHAGVDGTIPMGTLELYSSPTPVSYLWTATPYTIPFANSIMAQLGCPGTWGIPAGTTYIVHPDLQCGKDPYTYFGGYDFDDNYNFMNPCRIENSSLSLGTTENKSPIEIFPNPGSGKFQLIMNDEADISQVKITDITGHIIPIRVYNASANKFEIDLGNVSCGIYFVELPALNKTFTSKISVSK